MLVASRDRLTNGMERSNENWVDEGVLCDRKGGGAGFSLLCTFFNLLTGPFFLFPLSVLCVSIFPVWLAPLVSAGGSLLFFFSLFLLLLLLSSSLLPTDGGGWKIWRRRREGILLRPPPRMEDGLFFFCFGGKGFVCAYSSFLRSTTD